MAGESNPVSLLQEKQTFELELRMYDGDDPLDVWDRYIKWIEHTYAKSDKNLCAVLERAVQKFVDDKKFYDDPRYVDMWIKLAQNSTQPLNMFNYMQTEGIGVQQAALYTAWSNALEKQGDQQQADIIFLEGLKCGARPLDELQRHYRAFQSRLSDQAVGHGADVTQERQDLEPQLPSSVGRRTRRNRRVLASVNGEEGSVAGNSSTTVYQSSTSGLGQSLSVFDESHAGSVEPAVVEAKENLFMSQRTDKRTLQVFSSANVNPLSEPETTQTQNLVGPPHASNDPSAPLAAEQDPLANQSEDQPGVQVMYCKELLMRGPTEFCFEELRAERYFASIRQKLQEKQMYLSKEKERLRQQIEQKMQVKSTLPRENCQDKCKPFMVYNESTNPSTEPASAAVVQPKPFAVFNENVARGLPHEMLSALAVAPSKHNSLKLPVPHLRPRGSQSYPPTEKDCTDRSLSQAEEAIINSHRNKTLSISPDDTCDFARAAMLASTPFGGVRGQSGSVTGDGAVTEVVRGIPTESCPDTTPQTPAEPTQANKLSPILEVSQEWRSVSAVARHTHHSAGSASVVLPAVPDEGEEDMDQEMTAPLGEDQPSDPFSLEVRRRLLHKIGLRTLPDLHPEPGLLPSSILGLRLGDEVLSCLMKMPGLENHYVLPPEEDFVVLKVDRSPVPWDFYICSQLKARLPANTEEHFLNQSSCFLFEDGCVTIWRVPRDTTLAEWTADRDNKQLVAYLALRLVEMVIRMHTCHLVHGALCPHSLIYYPSPTESDPEHAVVMAIDFSSSLDLQLQMDTQTVGSLSNAADYIIKGLLSPTSSPYQLDLLGVAETVHQMLFKRCLDVVKTEAGWSLAESAETSGGPLHSVWHKFFQKILNSGERSTMTVLTELREDLTDYKENVVLTLVLTVI
ncbi:mitotic checkpoint serine/threonine-protein kinase BUB1 beta [Alosa pseudoharengus]|uniref:mitotic checkpoint serine/threonine-protein kinase BUB1 beta n=1 Tax=Alosa pseudoharengus TaxID=34774 RepID=UPI003F8BE107